MSPLRPRPCTCPGGRGARARAGSREGRAGKAGPVGVGPRPSGGTGQSRSAEKPGRGGAPELMNTEARAGRQPAAPAPFAQRFAAAAAAAAAAGSRGAAAAPRRR